ncbi:MAG TPA: peptidoglycan DD-metalloendopeptidase family protein [Spongiibacteraceae bacterium]|nr:peptidoglycan DD-metalloendopeptidase family protein [Spongiibacteraceae bacterium]
MLLLSFVGCVQQPAKVPPIESFEVPSRRIERHVVSAGETLFSIAWSYGIDFRRLAATNNLSPPYTLAAGRELRLPQRSEVTKATSGDDQKKGGRQRSAAMDGHAKGEHSAGVQARNDERSCSSIVATVKVLDGWHWPAAGAVIDRYSVHNPRQRGIDIRGELGEPVYAANSGKVVYAGSGLVGYGNLLIVKHNDRYLSAYAYNSRLLVDEGQIVKAGDRIAEIGDSGTDSAKLHFEIRCDGEPVDPLRVLPAR